MDSSEYDNIARLEGRHWWYRGMAAISLNLLRRAARGGKLRLLDAGCGPGGMLTRMSALGQPFGVDLHPLALAHARGKAPLARAAVEHLPFAEDSFDLVTSFDVLYHLAVGDDEAALREFARVLRKPGGLLLIRLPAWEALRGAHDLAVHTRHRYTAPELRAKLRAAGFRIKRLTYANTLLFLPILLRRLLQPDSQAGSDVELPSPALNRFLEFLLQLEKNWLTYFNLPFGVSLFALAQT
jgi:SAM-dependent methyltransferase